MKPKDITIIALLSAILYVSQVAVRFLPNVEAVSFLIIMFTLFFGVKVFFIIGIFVLLQFITYGFGDWVIFYFYVWFILAIITICLKKIIGTSPDLKSAIGWSVVSGFFGLAFGALYAIMFYFVGGVNMVFAKWTSGIMFDLVHCIFNFIICFGCYIPVSKVMSVIKKW